MSSFVGTAALVRLALRRDRIVLMAFVVILVVSISASAYATMELYPDSSSRLQAVAAINLTTSTLVLYGPIHDETSIGALSTFMAGMIGAIAVAILALFLVVRHTRTEEETGRLELLGATVVGRRAPLTAALLVTAGACLVAGAGTTLGLIAVGLPARGSVVIGLGYTCLGIAFAAVAGLTAQLVKSARAAAGMAGAVLGASYLLRAIGDASAGDGFGWVSWPSPVGWRHETRPYAGDRLWVLLLLLGLSAAIIAVAYVLAARRDFAAGLLPDRPRPAAAAAGLRTPLALAWRLQRGSLLAWATAFAVLGFVVGGLASNAGDFLKSQEAQDFIAKLGGVESLTDAFLALEFGFAGVFASVFGVQTVMRMRSEESGLRAEPVLATAVKRTTWAWSHLTLALTGALVLILVVGLTAGSARAITANDAGEFGRVVVAALAPLPAVWVMIGIVVVVFGLAPRWMVLGWVALVGFMLLGELGPLFDLSQTVMDVSPFAHVPRLPGGDLTVAPLVWLTAAAAGLIAVGLTGFRRRDVG